MGIKLKIGCEVCTRIVKKSTIDFLNQEELTDNSRYRVRNRNVPQKNQKEYFQYKYGNKK